MEKITYTRLTVPPIEPDKFAELVVQLKKVPYGRITIFMIDGKPDRIEEGIKSTKL